MKKITKTTTRYFCEVCNTKYRKESEAKACEARVIESSIFKIGDIVTNIEPRICSLSSPETPYSFEGKIIEIQGPQPADFDYEVRWLGGNTKRLNSHVFLCIVEYSCPVCKRTKSAAYYVPEIIFYSKDIQNKTVKNKKS